MIDKENIGAKQTSEKVVFACDSDEENDYKPNELMESSVDDASPMVLDDTIKTDSFMLHSDVEVEQEKLVEERENLLVNCAEYKVSFWI